MQGAPYQLHANTTPQKQFQVRVTFEDRDVFTKGPLAMQEYSHDGALKATLTLEEFATLAAQIQREMDEPSRSPEQTNITLYVQSVFSIVNRLIVNRILPEWKVWGFDLKVQIWHLKGAKSNNNGAPQHSNSMRNTNSVRVWCIDTDGLNPSPKLLNQTVETNVDPMKYLANRNQSIKMMKSWIYEPQYERSGYDPPPTWQCPEHQTKGVEHFVIFNRPNLEGITQSGKKEHFDKMVLSWQTKLANHPPNERHNVSKFVRHFGLKPCFMINDASVSEVIKKFHYPAEAVDRITKLFKTASTSLDSDLPLIGLALTADEFCDVFDLPPSIVRHIVAGGICAVKKNSKFGHLPPTEHALDEQTVAHSLAVRAVNIKLLKRTGPKTFEVRSVWRKELSLSLG